MVQVSQQLHYFVTPFLTLEIIIAKRPELTLPFQRNEADNYRPENL